MIQNILRDKPTRLFIVLAAIFITNALLAEFIGIKIFSLEDTVGVGRANLKLFGGVFSFHLSAGVLLWPVVFVMTDIINEYFGRKGVRFLSFLAVVLIAYAFIIVLAAINVAPSEYFKMGAGIEDPNGAFKGVFGQGLWIIVGSLTAFLVGQVLDVFVFHRIKRITGEKNIWIRATGSTLVSQLMDSFVVLFIAFYLGPRIEGDVTKQWTLQQLVVTGSGNYLYKFIVAIVLTPVIYFMHMWIEKYLGTDLAAKMKMSAMGKHV